MPRLWEENQDAWEAWNVIFALRAGGQPLLLSEARTYAEMYDLDQITLAAKMVAIEAAFQADRARRAEDAAATMKK